MATIYKVLGQTNPAITTLTPLYTVPSATSAVISTVTVANLSSTTATFRIAVQPTGAAIDPKNYIVYNATLAGNATTAFTIGVTLGATDVLSVYASTANVAFNAFGSEIN